MAQFNLSENDLQKFESEWATEIERDAKYWRENDAKLRAVKTVGTYEEFSEIVKAAHLQPLKKEEILKMHQKKTRVWNNVGLCATINSDATKQNLDTTATKRRSKEQQLTVPSTPAQFVDTWNRLSNECRLKLLKQTPLTVLNDLLQVESPPGMLGDLAILLKPSTDKVELAWHAELIRVLTFSSRFSLNLQFLTSPEKELYQKLFNNLNEEEDLQEIMNYIYKEFDLN